MCLSALHALQAAASRNSVGRGRHATNPMLRRLPQLQLKPPATRSLQRHNRHNQRGSRQMAAVAAAAATSELLSTIDRSCAALCLYRLTPHPGVSPMACCPGGDPAQAFISQFQLAGASQGPLAGLTVAVKDLFDVSVWVRDTTAPHRWRCGSGWPHSFNCQLLLLLTACCHPHTHTRQIAGRRTGFGSPTWRDTHPVADATAPPVAALLAAGVCAAQGLLVPGTASGHSSASVDHSAAHSPAQPPADCCRRHGGGQGPHGRAGLQPGRQQCALWHAPECSSAWPQHRRLQLWVSGELRGLAASRRVLW